MVSMMKCWFWDREWDEPLGILELDAEPEVGDTVTSGFIRYKPDTQWEVVRHPGLYFMLTLNGRVAERLNAPGC